MLHNNLQRYRPVIIASVVGLVIVIGAALIRFGVPSFTGPSPSSSPSTSSASTARVEADADEELAHAAESDRDADGLMDWEEALWRTDADNPDTDGDGTPDGEEVNTHRDPTRPAPNDAIAFEPLQMVVSTSTKSQKDDKRPTLTAALAERMMRRYFELKARGSDPRIVFKAQNEIWALIPPEFENPFADLPYWKEADIKITAHASPARVRRYGNEVAQALMQPTPTSTPPQIMYRLARTQNFALLKELKGYVTAIDAALKALREVEVPKPFVLHHLAIANLLIDQRAFLESVVHMEEDPFVAALAIRGYLENVPLFTRALAYTADALEAHGAFYSPSEPGYFFRQARDTYARIQKQQ